MQKVLPVKLEFWYMTTLSAQAFDTYCGGLIEWAFPVAQDQLVQLPQPP